MIYQLTAAITATSPCHIFSPPSSSPLRAKAGQHMVALCGCEGLLDLHVAQAKRGRSQGANLNNPWCCPALQRNGLVRKEA